MIEIRQREVQEREKGDSITGRGNRKEKEAWMTRWEIQWRVEKSQRRLER